jgi:uncharacterized protein with HEPN domain
MKDDRLYLVDMIEISRRIQRRINGVSQEDFDQNEDLQLALAHLLQTVGEAARLVSPAAREAFPTIPWKQITGMRHKIVHDYLQVRADIVWSTALAIGDLIAILAPIVDPIIEQTKSEKQRDKP